MRSLFLALALLATGCVDDREEFYGEYDTTFSTTIVRDAASALTFASPDARVLITHAGDDGVSVSVYANRGASIDCGFYMVPADGALIPDTRYHHDVCRVCDELRTGCWSFDMVSATGTLAGEQLTLSTSGAAKLSFPSGVDAGTASTTLSGPRTLTF